MTLGEKRVRTDFNVSGDIQIDEIKNATARLIDFVDEFIEGNLDDIDYEQVRLSELAKTAYEEAAMWAVKAITYK